MKTIQWAFRGSRAVSRQTILIPVPGLPFRQFTPVCDYYTSIIFQIKVIIKSARNLTEKRAFYVDIITVIRYSFVRRHFYGYKRAFGTKEYNKI